MMTMSMTTKGSTRRSAKAAGLMEYTFAEQRVAALLGPVAQAVPASTIHIQDRSSAWDGHPAPAKAAGSLRLALTVEGYPSGLSRPMRCLTEHRTTECPVHDNRDSLDYHTPKHCGIKTFP